MNRIQKSIADKLMHVAIGRHIKKEYYKRGVTPTAEQVMQDINPGSLVTLTQGGYSIEDIKGMVADVIRRKNAKNRMPV